MLLDKPYYDYDYEAKDEVVSSSKPLSIEDINAMNRNGDFEREMAGFGLGAFVATKPKPIPDMSNEELQEFVKKEEIKKQNKTI